MKNKLLSLILLISFFNLKSQTILLNENFESYPDFTISNFGQWNLLDLDQLYTWTLGGDFSTGWYAEWANAGSQMSFQIFNPSQANVTNNDSTIDPTQETRNFDPHSGNKYAGCWAGMMQESYKGNQDWLISPAITLGSSENILSMWVKTLSSLPGNERYLIGVYQGSGNPTQSSDFTIISTQPYSLAPLTWKQVSFNLDTYAGQTIRIGIECITQENSMLMVDDVLVTTSNTSLNIENTSSKENLVVYPNPSLGSINIDNAENLLKVELYNTEGRLLKTSDKNQLVFTELPSGNYIIKIYNKNGTNAIKKIIKK